MLPQANRDIVGLGVRISFYMQTFIYALLVMFGPTFENIISALWTCLLYGITYTVIALILGFKDRPELTLNDAVVIMYLLSLSWTTTYLATPWFWHLGRRMPLFEIVFFSHTILLLSCCLAILVSAKSFGSLPECNSSAVMVLFKEFHVLRTGQVVGFILLIVQLVGFLSITLYDYGICERRNRIFGSASQMFRRARRREDGNMGMRDTAQRSLTGRPLVIQQRGRNAPHAGGQASRSERIANISAIVIVWSILVVNTELTITRNYSMDMRRFVWGPGQISAMALLVVPVTSLAKVIAVRYRVDWLCYLLVAEEIPHPLRPHANGMDDRQEQGLVSHTTEQESFEGDEANIRSSAFHSDAVTGQQAERNGTEALERMEVTLPLSSSDTNGMIREPACQHSTKEPVKAVGSHPLTAPSGSRRLREQEMQQPSYS
ncbi:hypothetical protein ACEPAG_8363 [Sanghuangporus baumii]